MQPPDPHSFEPSTDPLRRLTFHDHFWVTSLLIWPPKAMDISYTPSIQPQPLNKLPMRQWIYALRVLPLNQTFSSSNKRHSDLSYRPEESTQVEPLHQRSLYLSWTNGDNIWKVFSTFLSMRKLPLGRPTPSLSSANNTSHCYSLSRHHATVFACLEPYKATLPRSGCMSWCFRAQLLPALSVSKMLPYRRMSLRLNGCCIYSRLARGTLGLEGFSFIRFCLLIRWGNLLIALHILVCSFLWRWYC